MNVKTARKAAEFAKVNDTDTLGRVKDVYLPGHQGKSYEVILRHEHGAVTTECLVTTSNGTLPCKGNTFQICYHSLAALMVAAQARGYKIKLCSTFENALMIQHVVSDPLVIILRSRQSGKQAYVVTERR